MATKPHRTFPFMYVREWTQIRPVHKLPRDFLWERQSQEITNYLGRSAKLGIHILDCFEDQIGEDSGFYGPACAIWWAIHPGQYMTETSWFNKYMGRLQTLADLGDTLLLDE